MFKKLRLRRKKGFSFKNKRVVRQGLQNNMYYVSKYTFLETSCPRESIRKEKEKRFCSSKALGHYNVNKNFLAYSPYTFSLTIHFSRVRYLSSNDDFSQNCLIAKYKI